MIDTKSVILRDTKQVGTTRDGCVVRNITGVARLAPTGRRWLEACHPGGRDGRIGPAHAIADFGIIIALADDIETARESAPKTPSGAIADWQALAKAVLLLLLPRMNSLARGVVAAQKKNAELARDELARNLRECAERGLDSYESAALIVARSKEALRAP